MGDFAEFWAVDLGEISSSLAFSVQHRRRMLRLALSALVAILATSTLPLGSLAQECGPILYVASQDDLDNISRDCPTVNGAIVINGTYSGPFVLSGVTNITRSIRGDWSSYEPLPQIPLVELRDLQHIETIYFPRLAASNFSAPNLETANSVTLGQQNYGSEVRLPALKYTGDLQVEGNYSRVILDSLQTVDEFLNICSIPFCDEDYGQSTIEDPLNITLPSLISAARLNIVGKTSSISAPKLASITQISKEPPRISLTLPQTPASISFPMLYFMEGDFEARGAIAGVDLSSLFNTSLDVIIETSYPLNVSLPLTESSGYVGLSGQIESVDVPNLRTISLFNVDSDLPVDCGPLEDRFNTDSLPSGSYFSCHSTFQPGRRLSTGVKAAIGVVVGIVGGAILIGLPYWWWRKKSNAKTKAPGEIELSSTGGGTGRGREADEPPAYSAN
ncbi:uncharacterized protein BJX67DRAFT_352163 [Aspergillus lucknowensis]|uniref:Uncharacterized protein n=1 Tax=Aspergillus lucknowensis TaxID=176173 RepID=A0ABR4LWK8_9EURO